MIKKILSIILLTLIFAVADEYLVRVDLGDDRLTPLSDQGFRILAELEHNAIVLITDAELERIRSFSHEIIDTQPTVGDYYLVLPMDSMIDLTLYGFILLQDGHDYLLK
jgi:hypothetical protein